MPLKDQEARKEYHREYMRRRYASDPAHKKRHKERTAAVNDRKRAEFKEFLAAQRDAGCVKCGESEHACLDFHHVDPAAKLFNVPAGWWRARKAVADEVAKCVVICANCHRKLHAGVIQL